MRNLDFSPPRRSKSERRGFARVRMRESILVGFVAIM